MREPLPRDFSVFSYLLLIPKALSFEGMVLPCMAAREPEGAVGGGL